MSVRIHQLSKDLGMENKELIELLKSRGYEVKSASSTVDNISAEALREEFAAQAPQLAEPEPEAPVAPKLPEGAFVKSAADIEREHQEKSVAEEAEKAAKADAKAKAKAADQAAKEKAAKEKAVAAAQNKAARIAPNRPDACPSGLGHPLRVGGAI